ncbi:MAG TPA: tRNA (adenosine(37)-N6)-threonylcarbamoyltransferase complex dimerization subunit type 1 TsaB [Rhizomicrobium sp.]|nr:tRNA (adenosine(37)-N6)-threonylcarbamoyltransferase complex dimerization subunit type 1 TsaB [Rhizomicrobium sp.]
MKILAVDTALGACSAAVLDGNAVLAHRLEVMDRGHAEALAPMVQALMQDAATSFADLQRLAVTTGPGTFTGQRVGIAFMRGLRLALKIPLVGITTLEAMAAPALHDTGADIAAVLHDAKRNEVYGGIYADDRTLLAPALLRLEEALGQIRRHARGKRVSLAGTAAAMANERLRADEVSISLTGIVYPDAIWVARLARQAPEPSVAPHPLYLRAPDARLPGSPPR